MPLHLPDFRQEFINGITCCSTIVPDVPGEIPGLGQLPIRAFARYHADAANEDALFVVLLESADNDSRFHFHVDIDRASAAKSTEGLTEHPVDVLKRICEHMLGRHANVGVTARYAVPRDELPKRGMIATLLGVETQSCGSSLELRGAKFALDGDIFTEMEWSYSEETDCVSGELGGETETEIEDEFLTKIADFLQIGIECFVLETTESEPSNADDSGTRQKKVQG